MRATTIYKVQTATPTTAGNNQTLTGVTTTTKHKQTAMESQAQLH